MHLNQQSKRIRFNIPKYLVPIIALGSAAFLAYGLFYAPILYSDDWSLMIGRWYYGNLQWFDITELRPLFKARLLILYSIIGLNISAFYLILWVLNVVNAIQVFFLICRFIPQSRMIALTMAALWLIYPANFTHMWLTMLQVHVVVTLVLLYAYLLILYADMNRWSILIAALICLLVSFGMHEYQLGITMVWALLLAFMYRTGSRKTMFGLLSPLIIGSLFLLWHTFGTSVVDVAQGYRYVSDLVYDPRVLISRLLMGCQIMVWAWVEPLQVAFNLNTLQAVAVIIIAMIFAGLLVHFLARVYPKLRRSPLITRQHLAQLRTFVILVVIGPILIAAGYFPVVTLFQPTVFPIGSRVNLLPSLGASITIVSLVAIIILYFKRRQPEIDLTVTAIIIPLILLGIAIQLQVRYDDRTSWNEQKQMWYEFFDLVPDLKDDTVVYLIFPDDEEKEASLNRNKRRTPLRGAGDVGVALNILYGRYALHGDVTTPELLFEEGVRNQFSGQITPYEKTIFMVYGGNPKRLRMIEDLRAEGLTNFYVPTYKPHEHIIQIPTTQTQYRWLVDVEN